MAVLVEYGCPACGAVAECWFPSPAPAAAPCGACGAPARRRYGFSIGGRASSPPSAAATPAGPACRGNADVPLLCHVDPSAAPGWIARYRSDNRTLDAHLERVETNPLSPPKPAGGHGHHHSHHHPPAG